ncbi:LysR family transcriptional regulator [Phenylobacterium sp.]|jgi:DNA-binding transcriptional LysR family regulator|uniref:LysR family transcriptional regulator n=1 Tax=Phenylobacterium sp. TaxID=1871053 RepID=UPI002F418F16
MDDAGRPADEGRTGGGTPGLHRRNAIIRHLPYFLAVAEQEHFQRAAERLNMTQPALSRRIQDMEAELGVALFERQRRGVRLTTAGRMLREDAARIMNAMDGAIHRLHALSRTGRLHLRLAFNDSALRNAVITEAVEHLRQDYPQIELELMPMLTEAQLAALQRRELDACFLYDFGFPHLGLNVLRIAAETLVLAVAENHRLARLPEVRLRDLADEPMSWPSRTAGARLHERMAAAWAAAGVTPHIMMEVLTAETTLNLAANNMAVGFTSSAVQPPPGVVLLPVADFNVELDLSLVWHPDNDQPAFRRLVELIRRSAP